MINGYNHYLYDFYMISELLYEITCFYIKSIAIFTINFVKLIDIKQNCKIYAAQSVIIKLLNSYFHINSLFIKHLSLC